MNAHYGLESIPNPRVWLPNNHLELDGSLPHGWWYCYFLNIWFYTNEIDLSIRINKS